MTFNPNGMDFRPCPQAAGPARLVLEVHEPVEEAMRARVYHGPGHKAWEEVPDPEITEDAYDVFARAADTGALKVVLSRGSEQR